MASSTYHQYDIVLVHQDATVICMVVGIDVADVVELLDSNMKNDLKGLEEVVQDGKVFVTKSRVEIADWIEQLDDLCIDHYCRNQVAFLKYNQ